MAGNANNNMSVMNNLLNNLQGGNLPMQGNDLNNVSNLDNIIKSQNAAIMQTHLGNNNNNQAPQINKNIEPSNNEYKNESDINDQHNQGKYAKKTIIYIYRNNEKCSTFNH